MTTFQEKLQKYADLVVQVGLNIQPGQNLIIRKAPLESAPLVRAIAASAYKAGARLVNVQWQDGELILNRFKYAPRDSFEDVPKWQIEAMKEHIAGGGAMLSIHADDPDLLSEQDHELVSTMMQAFQKAFLPVSGMIMKDAINWLVISYPAKPWASKIYPDVSPDEAVEKLWDTIFRICRIDQDDPVAAWKAHNKRLKTVSKYLNDKAYTTLKYSAPGTNLTIGLPEGHIWKGAESISEAGIPFIANIPTEEVFTMPHKDRVDGVVSSTKPLNYAGTVIDKFSITF